jgi:hypothetical protein
MACRKDLHVTSQPRPRDHDARRSGRVQCHLHILRAEQVKTMNGGAIVLAVAAAVVATAAASA